MSPSPHLRISWHRQATAKADKASASTAPITGRRAQTISVADASSDTIRTVILPISSTAPRDASTPPTVGYAAGPQWRRPHGWSQGGIDGRRQRTDLHRREVPECAPRARGRGDAVLADQANGMATSSALGSGAVP